MSSRDVRIVCPRPYCWCRPRRPWRFDALDSCPWPQYRLATRSGLHVSLWFRVLAEGRITSQFGDSRNKQTSGHHKKADRVPSEVNSRAERGDGTNNDGNVRKCPYTLFSIQHHVLRALYTQCVCCCCCFVTVLERLQAIFLTLQLRLH